MRCSTWLKGVAVAVAALMAPVLTGTGPSDASTIATTKHNLSTSGSGVHSINQDQICIFCHTPHDIRTSTPLWNRLDPSTLPSAYQLYTTSPTLTSATRNALLDNSSYSLLCLSCHDGSLSEIGSRVVNNGGTPIIMVDTNGTWRTSSLTMDGKGLTNDHPIGVNYPLAQMQNPGLRPVDTVNGLFGLAGTDTIFYKSSTGNYDSLECSTCHVVHDNTNSPFLRISNAGSTMCLACHIK